VTGAPQGAPQERFYFDTQSGLLVRYQKNVATAVGNAPLATDYADYRENDGVKIPFRWTLSRATGRFTIQIASLTINPPLDDARFAKPAGDVK